MPSATLDSLGLSVRDIKQAVYNFKRKSWAGNARKERTANGTDRIEIIEGNLMYADEWKGDGGILMGGETLSCFRKGEFPAIPLWGMNYSGGMEGNRVTKRELKIAECSSFEEYEKRFNEFLKQALMRTPRRMPFRGPVSFEASTFWYHHEVDELNTKDFYQKGCEFAGAQKSPMNWRVFYEGMLLLPRR